jgi:hypothetical protein
MTLYDDIMAHGGKPGPIKRRKRGRPEARIQKEIVQLLIVRLRAVVAVTDAGMLAKMGLGMSCGIPTGWPDITACLPSLGRFLGVEVKAPGGRQSPEQKLMQARIEALGGLYILAHSVEEFIEKFDARIPANS